MSLRLPPHGHPARDHLDIGLLASLGDRAVYRRLPTLRQCKAQAMAMMADDPAIRHMHSLVLRVDGSVELVRVGPRGGHTTVWRFGHP